MQTTSLKSRRRISQGWGICECCKWRLFGEFYFIPSLSPPLKMRKGKQQYSLPHALLSSTLHIQKTFQQNITAQRFNSFWPCSAAAADSSSSGAAARRHCIQWWEAAVSLSNHKCLNRIAAAPVNAVVLICQWKCQEGAYFNHRAPGPMCWSD